MAKGGSAKRPAQADDEAALTGKPRLGFFLNRAACSGSDIGVIFSEPSQMAFGSWELTYFMPDDMRSTDTPREQEGTWPDRLRRRDASRYVHEKHGVETAPQTLAKLAVTGSGPEYDLWGRIPYYPVKKLDEWVVARLRRRRSTSDWGGTGDARNSNS